jgi:hypothetical protein
MSFSREDKGEVDLINMQMLGIMPFLGKVDILRLREYA